MAKRRFIFDKEQFELVEVTADYEQPARDRQDLLWNDRVYNDMKATDGSDISSRAKHREYMKRNGLTTADDFKETWAKDAQKRAEYFQKGGSVTKEDVSRAIHDLESRKR